ncbi:MAG: hypothetical protein HY226_03645 [Candidatus Vogelbacteria bacterium]|nr:hypothetical protein [Candidatus Vogelbacteria bacterium]
MTSQAKIVTMGPSDASPTKMLHTQFASFSTGPFHTVFRSFGSASWSTKHSRLGNRNPQMIPDDFVDGIEDDDDDYEYDGPMA